MRTPYFVVDEAALRHNLEILKVVSERAGCKILLAQKAFSMFSVYPLLREYLAGTTASGLYEARLGHEHFGGETHVFSPAYRPDEFEELLSYADDFVFNSPAQVRTSARWPRRLVNPLVCVSILSARLRKVTPSMTPVHLAPVWARRWQTSTKISCPYWTACTSIPCVNRVLTRLKSLCGLLRKSSASICMA